MGRLWQDFMSNNDEIIHKWRHYFPVYERHLESWVDRRVVMLEIGVSKGGSTRMWERYLGPYATIVGIDIDEKCARFSKDGITIRIGSQSDPAFLESVIAEFGVPSIVLDDGSHHMNDVRATFDFLYPKLTDKRSTLLRICTRLSWPNTVAATTAIRTFSFTPKRGSFI